jgi:hypothetical protein
MSKQEDPHETPWRRSIEEAVGQAMADASDYPAARDQAMRMRHTLLESLARHLSPKIDAYARAQPHKMLEPARELAQAINHDLRKLGLAIVCPNTGRPGTLIADVVAYAGSGRFKFRVDTKDERGHRTHSATSSELPILRLTVAPHRVEGRDREHRQGR